MKTYRFRYDGISIANANVTLDGVDIADTISSVEFVHKIGEFPHVYLTMPMPGVVIETNARVQLRPEDETTLVLLGWTPPNNEQETEQ